LADKAVGLLQITVVIIEINKQVTYWQLVVLIKLTVVVSC